MRRTGILLIVLIVASAAFGDDDGKRKPAAGVRAIGTIEPEEVADIGAQVTGVLKRFGTDPRDSTKPIDFGTRVDVGTVLAELDPGPYQVLVHQAVADVQRAEAELKLAMAQLRKAELEGQRVKQLKDQKAVAATEAELAEVGIEIARAGVEVARAGVQQAKTKLGAAELNLSYTIIRSPIKGVVVDRRINVGQTVVSSVNAPSLFLLATDLRKLQVWASVPEAEISRVHKGQAVRFTVDAFPKQVFTGTVSQVRLNASMTANKVTYTVVVNAENTTGKLLPYLTAEVEFVPDQGR